MSTLGILFSTLLDHPSDDDLRARLRAELIAEGSWDWPTLRQYVLDHPETDGPRLLAADWLEYDDQHDLADFVRTQCRLLQMLDVYGVSVMSQSETIRLGQIAQKLGPKLATCLTEDLIDVDHLEIEVENWNQLTLRGEGVTMTYVRGFLGSLEIPTTRFLSRAEDLFSRQPLLTVKLTDKTPRAVREGWWWADSCLSATSPAYANYIPPALYHEMLRQTAHPRLGMSIPAAELTFRTPESATAALSAACVSYGRNLVGLKRLGLSERAR